MSKVLKRYWWLIKLVSANGYTMGAEVGCANGATTYRLLKFCKELKLYAIDKWEKVEGGAEAGEMGAIYGEPGCTAWDPVRGFAIFNRTTRRYANRLTILRGDSVMMADQVPDGSLDFVFIDADHRYHAVLKDMAAWVPKLKPEGILCGHDIHLPGVLKAVSEKVPNYIDTGSDHVWTAKKEDYEG